MTSSEKSIEKNLGELSCEATPRRKRRRISKEEFAALVELKGKLIKSKEKVFESVSEDAHSEYLDFNHCDNCRFIGYNCHKTCGILMKWMHKAGKVKTEAAFGLTNRVTSEKEHTDTSSVNLGVSEAVDNAINEELNGNAMKYYEDFAFSDLNSYEISEDD